jgi:tripartite motif-containing protein 71
MMRILAFAASCVVLSAFASRAGAAQFGSYGSGSDQFIEPQGIAVEQESGDVYVLDSNNHRVEKYTSGGRFLYAWGWGVADGKTQALQVCTTECHAGLAGAGAGQLGFAEGIAVDNEPSSPSYKDVYVVDIGQHRVEKFNPAGEFLLMIGGGVNETARERAERANEDVCPVKPSDRCGEGNRATTPGHFSFHSEGDFVAVGQGGTVYVGDFNRVQEFSPDGTYERQVTFPAPSADGPEVGGIPGLAVNSTGDLYVIRNGTEGVTEYTSTGTLLRTLDSEGTAENTEGPTPAMTLDSLGDLFVDEHRPELHRIVEYASGGDQVASFDVGMEDGLHGLAFGDRAGLLYVVNTNNNVSPLVARVRIVRPSAVEPLAACGWCGWTGG